MRVLAAMSGGVDSSVAVARAVVSSSLEVLEDEGDQGAGRGEGKRQVREGGVHSGDNVPVEQQHPCHLPENDDGAGYQECGEGYPEKDLENAFHGVWS